MSRQNTNFWHALLEISTDLEERARLWNGYLGLNLPAWSLDIERPKSGSPDPQIAPPTGGWPQLSSTDKATLDRIALRCGGHPHFSQPDFMNLSDIRFSKRVALDGLTLVSCSFRNAIFEKGLHAADGTRFFEECYFDAASFQSGVNFYKIQCHGPLYFSDVQFQYAGFLSVQFQGGASFARSVFKRGAKFDDSQFEERYWSGGITVLQLADFRGSAFTGHTSFRNVTFGKDERAYRVRSWPSRRADFSNARFEAPTVFRRASFAGPPAFFEAKLHEDTDFEDVQWHNFAERRVDVDYAVRAWERLELMMNQLEKPLDRHLFFRLKMRAQRRRSGSFLRLLSWAFDKTSDYGWDVRRACVSWAAHWVAAGAVLSINALGAGGCGPQWQIILAALGVSFSNAHAFLFLTSDGGYLFAGLKLIQANDAWGIVAVVGIVQAILGPAFLFLMLLTIRNRFRLA